MLIDAENYCLHASRHAANYSAKRWMEQNRLKSPISWLHADIVAVKEQDKESWHSSIAMDTKLQPPADRLRQQ
jgi:hypothetical protein